MGGWWVLMEGAGGTRAKRVMALFGTMSIDVIVWGATQQAAAAALPFLGGQVLHVHVVCKSGKTTFFARGGAPAAVRRARSPSRRAHTGRSAPRTRRVSLAATERRTRALSIGVQRQALSLCPLPRRSRVEYGGRADPHGAGAKQVRAARDGRRLR